MKAPAIPLVHVHTETAPHQELAAAVVRQAITDLEHPSEMVRDSARLFLGGNEAFAGVRWPGLSRRSCAPECDGADGGVNGHSARRTRRGTSRCRMAGRWQAFCDRQFPCDKLPRTRRMPHMATVVAPQPAVKPGAAPRADRVFYSSMAIVLAVTVFIGFAPTYYLRALFGAPPTVTGATSLSPLAHLHGALFTGWVLLFIVQTALVASHRTRLHQRLGIAGGVLAAAIVVVGVRTAVASAARGAAPPGVDPLAFLSIPLFDMLLFASFVSAALWYRGQREAHKRLMLLAYISIIAAAMARFPGVLPYGPLVFFGLAFLFLVTAVMYDLVSRRRVHAAYVWGGALLVLSVPLRLIISGTATWRTIAVFLTG